MIAALLLCAVVFVLGLLLRALGLSMVRRAEALERQHLRAQLDQERRRRYSGGAP